MIELAQHIEALLLENDCVIVPGLGGFMAHYMPAERVEEENLFLPPTRTIGFNPQLKMNDGLLVQSYMTVYGTSFPDATRLVEKEVEKLLALLHEEGKASLPNVGELRYSIQGTYEFTPYNHKLATPSLYGLESFEMKELKALANAAVRKQPILPMPVGHPVTRRRRVEVRLSLTRLVGTVAMIAIAALFFLVSTPIENTEIVKGNYAQLLPAELFGQIEHQSLLTHSVTVDQTKKKGKTSTEKKKEVKPVAVREVKVAQPQPQQPVPAPQPDTKAAKPAEVPAAQPKAKPATTPASKAPATVETKSYHIIVASVGTEKDAEAQAKRLREAGHAGAKAIIGDGKMRVSIRSFTTETEAYRALNKIRENEAYRSAWVLKKK